MNTRSAARYATMGSLLAMIALCLAWETVLAPLRPGGSWLMLKTLPLLLPLVGVLRGEPRTCQWASMFVLAYFTEGVVRAWSEHGLSAVLALAETALALLFFAACIVYVRTFPGKIRYR
jgi:uncharacterized membrane protein